MTIDGAILLNLLIAGILTFIFGFVALRLLQRAMVRNMMTTAGRPPPDEGADTALRRPAAEPLAISAGSGAPAASEPTTRILWRMVAAHAAAGLAYAFVAAVILLPMSGMELFPLRTSVVVWAFAWPTVLVLNFLIGPDRKRQLLVIGLYFGVLALLCSWAVLVGTPPLTLFGVTFPAFAQPLFFWLIHAAPTVFLLLFLNRTIRTIGPVVIVFAMVLLFGAQLLLTIATSDYFIRPLVEFAVATGIGGTGTFWTVSIVGMLAAAWPAWRVAAFLRDRYAAKRTSDLMMTVTAIWLLETLFLAFSMARESGAIGAAAALAPLVTWRLVLFILLRPVFRLAESRPPLRLLLLRVFGFGRRTRRLLDLLGARWRLIGSIDLIAAPDLASRTIEPASFMAFLRGRLSSQFILDDSALAERFAALDHRPDPDGRYRINPLFCGNDMWKEAVIRLMGEASLVVMDLRGFGPQRQGCVYEIQTLMDLVQLDRLVFLIDRTTDRPTLERVVGERWDALSADSPNLAAGGSALQLIDTNEGDVAALKRLLSIVRLPAADPSSAAP